MDIRVINSIVAAVLTAVIGALPLTLRRDRLAYLFAISNLTLAFWNLGDVVVLLPESHDVKLFIFRANYIAGIFCVWFFYLFMFAYIRRPVDHYRWIWKSLKIVGLVLTPLSFTPFLVKDLETHVSPFKEIPGVGMPLFMVYLITGFVIPLQQVFVEYRSATGLTKRQIGYMFLALFFILLEALAFFFSLYFKSIPPYYFQLQVAYVLVLAYAIARYRLMDINLVFRYATIYLLFALSLTAPFSAVAIYSSSHVVVVLLIFTVFLIAPLLEKKCIGWFRRFVDKLPPFRGRYQFLNDTPGFQRIISSSASVKHWAANLADSVNRLLEVDNTAVFVIDENHQMYMAMSAVGGDFGKLVYASPKVTDPLSVHLRSSRKILQQEYVEFEVAEADRSLVLNSMRLIKADLCAPFFNGDKLIGFVSIGQKYKRGLNLFRPQHFKLSSILDFLDFAPTSTPAFAYVHRALSMELGLKNSGDALKLNADQVTEGFNRLVNKRGWVEKIPRVDQIRLRSEGLNLLDRLRSQTKEGVSVLTPLEESTLNAAVLAHFYQTELIGYWREDNINDEDTKALAGLVQGAQGALMVIFVTLAGQMKSVEWAHDLRHPFAKGSFKVLDAMLMGKLGPLTPEQYHALANIQTDAKFVESHITELVNPETSGALRKKQTKMNDLLKTVGERYTYFAGLSGIDFRLVAPPEDVWVQCDPDLIQYRVFNNLLDNAMRHTPAGGIVELGVRPVGKGGVAHCFVRNTGGAPITKEALPHLFERGSPSKRPTSGQSGLAGLGLFNVEKVVSAHGGKIEVKSTQEEGTIFEFTLPLAGVGVQPK